MICLQTGVARGLPPELNRVLKFASCQYVVKAAA